MCACVGAYVYVPRGSTRIYFSQYMELHWCVCVCVCVSGGVGVGEGVRVRVRVHVRVPVRVHFGSLCIQ